MSSSNPRVYIACLAAYNNGRLHGEWIDADQSEDQIQAEIDEMLESSPIPDVEEWAVHDYDEMPNLGEYPSVARIAEVGRLASKHGAEAVEAYLSHMGEDADLGDFKGSYQGEFRSREDFAERFAEDCGLLDDVPETLKMYLDWDAYARDLFISDFFEENGHVFSRY